MTIDELLARHPAPWREVPMGWPRDCNLKEVDHSVALMLADIINAYAALKECVKAADKMRKLLFVETTSEGDFKFCGQIIRRASMVLDRPPIISEMADYDAARAKVKP